MTKPLKKKILSFIGITLGGIFIGIVFSSYIMLKLSVPVTDGSLMLEGVHSDIEITFDKMGIPQIWAENEADAYFGLGYQHAADRLFQMDLARRVAQGRLSEMIGEATLEIDTEQRKIGHMRMAKEALPNLSEHNRQRLQSYVKGINAYIKNCRALPFEYRLMPVSCEDWTIVDCLSLLSFQSWFSNALMNKDEAYANFVKKLGYEKAKSLLIPYPDWAPTTVKKDEYSNISNNNLLVYSYKFPKINYKAKMSLFQRELTESLFKNNGLPFLMTEASNAWVVAPKKSESGYAILASDPHLEISRLPQFWYAVGIHVKDSLNVLGITAPGLPFVVMGHNGQAAWAFTAGGTDVIEYYNLKTNPDNENEYLTEGGYQSFEIIIDTIKTISGFEIVTHKLSPYGPIVEESPEKNEAVAFYWVGFDSDLNLATNSGFDLHKVDNYDDFRTIVTGFGALDVNMMYADAAGNIGYQLSTMLMNHEDSINLPFDAKTTKFEKSFYPQDKTPHTQNPLRGWIASCNNLPEYSPYVRGNYFVDRILSVEHYLKSKDKFIVDDMTNFQMDLTDRYMLRFKDDFADALSQIGEDDKAEKMRQWDGLCDSASYEASLLNIYLNKLKKYTFEDELGTLYSQIPARWIEQYRNNDWQIWYDDINTKDTVETYQDISKKSMKEAIELADGRVWGELLTIQMAHPLSVIPVIGDLLGLSTERDSHQGTTGTLNATFPRMNPDGTFDALAGPSFRFVIDFADVDKATMVLPAGNSGNPMSDHFLDFYDMWKSGERWTTPFGYEKVKENAVSILILSPVEKN